jgi:hypothetical protein
MYTLGLDHSLDLEQVLILPCLRTEDQRTEMDRESSDPWMPGCIPSFSTAHVQASDQSAQELSTIRFLGPDHHRNKFWSRLACEPTMQKRPKWSGARISVVAVVFATLGPLKPLHTCKHSIKVLKSVSDEFHWVGSYLEQFWIFPCMRIIDEVTEA